MARALILRVAEVGVEEARRHFVAAVTAGRLVIFPTDTVYGIGARADDEAAVARLFEVKQRPADRPLPVLLGSWAELPHVVGDWPPAAQRLAHAFWPGPLTVVTRRHPRLAPAVVSGGDTVGVRMPDHCGLREWLAACDFPVAATSANLSAGLSPRELQAVPLALVESAALVLDDGPCPGGRASTVVEVTVDPVVIRRPGPITEAQIRQVLGQ